MCVCRKADTDSFAVLAEDRHPLLASQW